MSYQPIENYGIIGNMRTVALVGMNGSIDGTATHTLIRPAFSERFWITRTAAVSEFLPTLMACGTNNSIGLPRTSWLRASC